jgi:AraC family transcriptional regulator of adaptative response/methylated-DNA-[protein]-cysteine methyltransferase
MPVTAVRTTGIFCRETCGASPLPQNTLQLDTAVDALFAGYRPCLRCQPEIPETPRARRGLRRVSMLGTLRHPRRRAPAEGLIHLALLQTPIGPMVAGVAPDGLALLEFSDRPMLETQLSIVQRRFHAKAQPGRTRLHDRVQAALDAYFLGEATCFDLPIAEPGTPFQQRVWRSLGEIPIGATTSYGALAAEVGRTGASRAVGHANGMNRIAVLIPCHRVVGSDGALTGYGGGVWRKARLLDHERRLAATSANADLAAASS